MLEPVRPVVDGEDPLDPGEHRTRRGPIDPTLLQLAPALRRHLSICAGLAVATAVVVLAQAEIIGRELPRLIDGDLEAATPLAGVLVAIGLGRFVLRWATEVSAARAAAASRAAITDRVIAHALVVDEPGAAEATPARVTTLVTDGIDALDPWIREYVPALCIAVVLPLAAGARILVADLTSAVILLVAIPLIPVFMVLIGRLAEDRADRQWATLQRLAAHFHDVLVGLPTLRLFGQAGAQVQRVRAVAEQYRVAVMRTLRVAFLSAAAMELLAMLSVALVAVTIGYRLSVGDVTLQAALIVLLLAPECSLPIRRVGAAFHAAQAGTDAADELSELLATTTTPDGPVDVLPTSEPTTPTLRISGATVVDPDRGRRVGPVDLDVHAGSLVALVGASGAGKSTLLDAVRCRVPLHRGHVELAGIDVTDLSRTARADALVWIPQLPDPVGSDVRAAVAAGSDPVDAAAVDHALAAVDLVGFAERRPSELSGGECQRLAVARGVLRARTAPGARVLLADEPTSHLDDRRAALVIEALRRMAAEGCAVVVATHDPDLIGAADHVVRLDEGPSTPEDGSPPIIGHADPDDVPSAPSPISSHAGAAGAATEADRTTTATAWRNHSGDDLAWFRQMARPVRWRLFAGRTLAVLTELCSIGLAATATWMLVRASTHTPFAELAVAAVAVRTFAIGKGVLRYSERLVSHDTTFRMLADVRGAVVARLGRIAPAGVPGMERGDVMARVVDDVDRLADQELRVMGPMTSGLAVGLLAVVASATVAPGFGVAYAVAVIVVAVALPAATRVLTAGTVRDQVSARAELAGATLEVVEHGDELTTTGAAGTWVGRIWNASTSIGRIDRRRGTRIGVLEGLAALAAPALAATIVVVDRWIGGTVDGALLGVAVLVPFALIEVLAPLLHAGEQQASVQVAAARLRTVLDAPDPVTEPADPEALATHPPLVLDDVTLRWPGAASPVLSGLDMRLEPDTLARIDGPSGTGKSTLAAALVRFIGVDEGRYLLGDVDTTQAGGDNIREVVTWCQQTPWLAASSLRENLHLAAPDATDDEMWTALDAVQLSDWAVALPDGLSSEVGRDGSAMSGGQRQRLALARVLLAGHPIVVLDEPTAHLDAPTAERVLRDLLVALEGRTVLLLGHGTALPDTEHSSGRVVVPGGDDGRWTRLDLTAFSTR